MNTDRTTRLAAFMLAVLMAAGINGAMLWQFETLARDGVLACAGPAAVMTLETLGSVAPRT